MDLEQRMAGLEKRARRFQWLLTGAAGLVLLSLLAWAWWLHAGGPASAGHEAMERVVDAPRGGMKVPEAAGHGWAYVAAAQPSSRVHMVSGGDPAKNAVTIDSPKFSDVPDMAIPFEREEDTVVLVFFSTGDMQMELGSTAILHLGYDERHPITGHTQFTLLRRHTLVEHYKEYGTDFVWMGRVPRGKKIIKVRWCSPNRRPVTMGVKSGSPRELVLVEFNDPPEVAGGA